MFFKHNFNHLFSIVNRLKKLIKINYSLLIKRENYEHFCHSFSPSSLSLDSVEPRLTIYMTSDGLTESGLYS